MGKWHLGVEKGAQELEDAWRCADKRESDRRHRREAAALRAANQRIAPACISCWFISVVVALRSLPVCVCIFSDAPGSFLLCFFFILFFLPLSFRLLLWFCSFLFCFFHSEYISLSHFSAYVCHVTTAGSLGDQLKCDNQSINQIKSTKKVVPRFMQVVLGWTRLDSSIHLQICIS